MSGDLLTGSSVLMCTHGGTVTAITGNGRVQAAGGFVLRSLDTFTIAGCLITNHPCVTVRWDVAALRSEVLGDATLTDESLGFCLAADQAVQGVVKVLVTQPRVSGL